MPSQDQAPEAFLKERRQALCVSPRSSDLSHILVCRELVEGVESDQLRDRLGFSVDEFSPFCSWGPAADYPSNVEFSLTWLLARNALPLNDVCFKADLADMPDCHRCAHEME